MNVQRRSTYRSVKILLIAIAGSMMALPVFAQNKKQSERGSFPVPTPPAPMSEQPGLQQEAGTNPELQPVPRMMRRGIEPAGYVVPPPGNLRDFSLIYAAEPEPYELKEGDIIEVIVDEKGNATSKSIFNRQRNGSYKAEIKEFLRIGDSGNLRPAAQDSPKVDTTLTSRLQSNGQMNDSEGMNFRISVFIEEVKPNGNLVIAGHKEITYNKERWNYNVHGTISKNDITRDNTILSSKIVNGGVYKNTRGKVYDSTKRPWGVRLVDLLSPF